MSNSLLISLSSSGQVAPNQWLNYVNGVNYQVAVQTPQYRIDSFDSLMRTPITATPGSGTSSGGAQPGNNSTSAGSSSNGVASQTNYSVGASPSPSGRELWKSGRRFLSHAIALQPRGAAAWHFHGNRESL